MKRLWRWFTRKFRGGRRALAERVVVNRSLRNRVIDQFHSAYYYQGRVGGTWQQTEWLGIPTRKCPLDLWILQELMSELRPDWVIETGTRRGGSATFIASICELLGHGRVLAIDATSRVALVHPRVDYLIGPSTSEEIIERVRLRVAGAESILVVLGADHDARYVSRELELYHSFVTPGSYLLVEDTNVNGHPVEFGVGPGPMEAVDAFLPTHPEFEVDRSQEKFLLTFNPRGYLRRRAIWERRGALRASPPTSHATPSAGMDAAVGTRGSGLD